MAQNIAGAILRVENVAGTGEIIITEAVFDAPGAKDVIRAARMKITEDRAILRGIDHEVTFYRLR